ncbi:MAG TPA: prolyl oligopeptidase family serine peptidase, partial [Solirubrobacteraceae bacterium]|nr:prolyl oligopeptidase family serine peptidase [Solirubrobacteraceae bacterium]
HRHALEVEVRITHREIGEMVDCRRHVVEGLRPAAALASEAAVLDVERVTMLGHSAGGQLALWAAGRDELPAGAPGAGPRVVADRVLALAAVCDLEAAGRPAHVLLGGGPADVPDRWAQADPMRRIPLAVPVGLVHALGDTTVSVARSREYLATARAAGADVTLAEVPGGHRDPINPATTAWRTAAQWLSASAGELRP